ncbi:pyridoxamine 5'-phosphate oxidase family protein [Salinibacterium sp. G-O1]|uniref:pyridoxamine 5'-phosphate oxidase family protein n=1 Tax=Salinibacterium sp. G-O1 TaxID=3046208 RepID=UPI0024BBA250|nr:pyridoxamine 5'-phosphate oxidase family protein [Salinibacterium sp. G-O1]MDJ0335788.1 pyridoxamine 5'-phosphate oxidase family protein [Salinibacterium sp. G-O1]
MSHDVPDATPAPDRFLSAAGLQFVTEYHLATLSTLSADGTIHAVPVGFTYEAGIARVITSGGSQKVLNAVRGGIATISQVDRATWLTLSGTVSIHDDAETVADAVQRYAVRYRQPRVNPLRVAMLVTVTKSMGSAQLLVPKTP